MPYASQRDRNPKLLELEKSVWPAPPLNLFCFDGPGIGAHDLRWDDPGQMALNASFLVCGVNVYRSFDSEFGPYERLTDLPLGATFWRDQTDNALVEEVVRDEKWVLRGECNDAGDITSPRYVFRTQICPIVKAGSQAVTADNPRDVRVWVDGIPVPVSRVIGYTGEIEIDVISYPNVALQKNDTPTIPGPNSVVTVAYLYNRSVLRTDLAQRIFYRITTVGMPVEFGPQAINPQNLVETPLEHAAFTSNMEFEKLDWIWQEAVRRNRWILGQGGERIKLFIQKQNGIPCSCVQDIALNEYKKQPLNDCLKCYGVGILGGFEGAYDIIIAPDDAEKRHAQTDIGRRLDHNYEVWTGPSPLISQRDFLLKINGDRYSVGPVRMPSNRGMLLQQHFTIGSFDEKDIRFQVPSDNPFLNALDRVRPISPESQAAAGVTDKPEIPSERQLRGRTKAWEGITW
jgi:hypothetical protein